MYSRFKTLENFGEEELKQIQSSTAAVVGLGATGSVAAEHLARHGVNLVLIDRDYLERNDCYSSNIYTPEQCENSIPKAVAAEKKLEKFTEVKTHIESLGSGNIDLLEEADIILDGTDNLETRFLLNEYSKKNDKPWIYTGAIADEGYSMLFNQKCFNCVFKQIQAGSLETCETVGILRESSSIAGSLTASRAVKYLAGKEVAEKLETIRGESFSVESIGCKVCEEGKYNLLESGKNISKVCGENKYQLEKEVDQNAFDKLNSHGETVAENKYLTRVRIKGRSFTLFRDGRAIIEARDRGHAENLFSEMIGI